MHKRRAHLSKLLKLKDWITVPEAARHLSDLLEEDVADADVLRLALNGHLTLSVLFAKTIFSDGALSAKCGPILRRDQLSDEEAGQVSIFDEEDDARRGLVYLDADRYLKLEKTEFVRGVWDLMMLGEERSFVEQAYDEWTKGPGVNPPFGSAYLSQQEGSACRLASGLPDGSRFVVRTAALQELEARILDLDKRKEQPLLKRERNTLLVIIAALASLAKIDWKKPSKAADVIESETQRMGARVSQRTILDHLNRIPAALEDRGYDGVED